MLHKSYQGSSGGSILTYRQQKRDASKDGGGKQHRVRSTFATVRCDQHGTITIKGCDGRHLRIPIPKTRKEKYKLGCPFCNPL